MERSQVTVPHLSVPSAAVQCPTSTHHLEHHRARLRLPAPHFLLHLLAVLALVHGHPVVLQPHAHFALTPTQASRQAGRQASRQAGRHAGRGAARREGRQIQWAWEERDGRKEGRKEGGRIRMVVVNGGPSSGVTTACIHFKSATLNQTLNHAAY